mmetsp:Transcript_43291/g.119722  ORF Transcript_43291/g.119722 Transcript_43291/m.119722 type:complete len:231 (+) Transcript_43291:145-837(+)
MRASSHMRSSTLRHETLVQLLRQLVLLARRVQFREGPVLAISQRLKRRGRSHCLSADGLARRLIAKAVDHVVVCVLRVVTLVVDGVWALVLVTTITIRTSVPVQGPLQKGHCLDVHKFVLPGGVHDVRISHANSALVRGHLHEPSWLHEGAEGPEEESHEVFVTPIDHGMAIEEPLDGAGVWEVVINSTQGAINFLEALVDCDARAIHAMVDLRIMLLEGLNALVNLLVP